MTTLLMATVTGFVVPNLALWSPYSLVAHVLWHVAWPPEVWGGVIVWTGISGLGLSLVAVPSPSTA